MTEEALSPAPAAPEPVAQEAPQVEDKAQDTPEPEQAEKPKEDAPKRSKNPREALEKAFKADLDAKPEAKPEAPKAEAKPAEAPKVEAKPAEAKADDKAEDKPKPAPHAAPPSRFSPEAKAEWEKAPEHVRAETHRAIKEMERGIAEKDATLKPLQPFIKMAQDSGTTVDKALQAYVQMETTLRQNPAQGLRALAQNMGMTPQQMAALLTNQQPGQADPRDRELMQLRQTVQRMEQQFGQVTQTVQQQRESSVLQTVEQFAAQHPRFDELAPEIARLIETGYASDLSDAYTKAERLNPAPPAPVQPAVAPPAQTRPARSLTGAPSPGSNPATARTPSKSPREALTRAFGV